MPPSPVDFPGDKQQTPLGVLREVFGFDSFRGQQLAIIEHVTTGGDAVVLMPTGGGKSLCYQVSALLRPGLGVVVFAADRVDEGPSGRAAPTGGARCRVELAAVPRRDDGSRTRGP